MITAIWNILIVFFFSIQFMILADWLLEKMKVQVDFQNIYLKTAVFFFSGMAIYLTVLRTFSLLFHSFKIAFWCSVLLCACLDIVNRKSYKKLSRLHGKVVCLGALLWIFSLLHQMVIWPLGELGGLHLYSNFGSGNTMRYQNLALYFVSNDCIPVLNQSYGQSLLSSLCCMLGLNTSVFSMALWLAVCRVMMLFLLYGIMQLFFSKKMSLMLTVVVFFGSVSLTVYPIDVLDTGSPFGYNGYTDSIAGVCIFVIYLSYLYYILTTDCKINLFHFAFSICVMAYNCMSAPQNVIMIAVVGFFCILALLCKKRFDLVRKSCVVLIPIVIGVILGACEGGMLTPAFMVQNIDIPGVMKTVREETAFTLWPVLSYHVSSGIGFSEWSFDMPYIRDIVNYAVEALHSGCYGFGMFWISVLAWDSMRVIFWPLLGMLGMVALAYSKKDDKIGFWAIAGLTILTVGYLISFLFSYNGYKKELIRFMLPGYFLGMIFVSIMLGKLQKKTVFFKCISALCIFMILIGQIPYRIMEMVSNIRNYQMIESIKQMILFENKYIG